MKRPKTFTEATAQYVHRFTMEHVPNWARDVRPDGTYYAPQFRSDLEWYENTRFKGEEGWLGVKDSCFTTGQTWPLGQALSEPFTK